VPVRQNYLKIYNIRERGQRNQEKQEKKKQLLLRKVHQTHLKMKKPQRQPPQKLPLLLVKIA